MKAIETRYNGCRFRSRLEARWAVFFDAMGIEYRYEPEGFEIDINWWCRGEGDPIDIERYLPDFYLPGSQTWIEVKGDLASMENRKWQAIAWACDWGCQLPWLEDSHGSNSGLVMLGDVPPEKWHQSGVFAVPMHTIIQHSKGGRIQRCTFNKDGAEFLPGSFMEQEYFDASWSEDRPLEAAIQKRGLTAWPSKPIQPAPGLIGAYRKARSARFEFGEAG